MEGQPKKLILGDTVMTFGLIPYRPGPGRQISGIWATHPSIDSAVRSLIVPALPVTMPMLIEYDAVRTEFPHGSKLPVDQKTPALYMARHTQDSVTALRPPILTEHGTPYSTVANSLELLRPLLSSLIIKPQQCTSIDQILLDGFIRWQPFSVIYDEVYQLPYSYYGGIKPWVFRDLVGLGFGTIEIKRSKSKPGRPGKAFVPNEWGRQFVELISRDSRLHVNDDMRRGARHRKLVDFRQRIMTEQKKLDAYHLKPPKRIVERVQNMNDMYGEQ